MNTPDRPRERRFFCTIEEVHSGDDLILLVNLDIDGFYKRTRARLQGVDTPDAYKEKADTKAGSVRDQVRRLTSSRTCVIEVHAEGKGGWIVTLHVKDGNEWINLNERLIEMGYVYRKAEG